MIISFRVKKTGWIAGLPQRKYRAVLRKAFKEAATFWHRVLRPKHFTHAGATEYGYEPRSQRYTWRKLKTFGHTFPLVFTGESRERTRIRRITGTYKGSKVIMNAPSLNYRHPNRSRTMREELTTISMKEGKRIAKLIARRLEVGFNAIRTRRVRKVG
jgi:hypothetical protein